MTDDPMDELDRLVQAGARDYNRPAAVPRDEMWERIRAARERDRAHARPAFIFSRSRWLLGAVAAAAVLMIGIALGRLYEQSMRGATTETAAAVPPVASVAVDTPQATTTPSDTPPSAGSRSSGTALAEGGARSGRNIRQAPSAAVVRPNVEASAGAGSGTNSMAYRLAVVDHLAGAEALLTSFRTGSKRGEIDPEITRWARSLLTTTRLLEATASQQDPTMRRLLGDLELVLLQIAQYSAGARDTEELQLIEHSIERRGVIAKIRTTIPARLTPAGT